MRYLILGFSIAGVSAARQIRHHYPDAEISAVSEEREVPYYRPLIPYLTEGREIDLSFPDDPVNTLGVSITHGRVKALRSDEKRVFLEDGTTLEYDRLLIATGARPVIPPIPGVDSPGVFTLRSIEDALRIRKFSEGRDNALVIGGGLVGIKAAVSLRQRGMNVTLVEILEEVLTGRLDRKGAGMIKEALQKEGIQVRTSETVEEIYPGNEGIRGAKLSSGEINAEMAVIATGVRPSVDFLRDSQVNINKGILVAEDLSTNVEGVYAAGDVVELKEPLSGEHRVSGLWTMAEEMGRVAGKNMVGQRATFSGFLSVMNATEILGIPFISVGLIEGEDLETHVIEHPEGYRRLLFRDNSLVGVVLFGDVRRAGLYTSLIRNQIGLNALREKLLTGKLTYADVIGGGVR